MGKLRKKYPDLLKGKDAWTSDWGSTRRMVIGPFASESVAKSFYGDWKKAGGDGYVWHSTDGLEVEKLTEKRSEEHTSELQSLMRISYAVFCLKKKNQTKTTHNKYK